MREPGHRIKDFEPVETANLRSNNNPIADPTNLLVCPGKATTDRQLYRQDQHFNMSNR